jgi:hypothetical protein
MQVCKQVSVRTQAQNGFTDGFMSFKNDKIARKVTFLTCCGQNLSVNIQSLLEFYGNYLAP